MIGGAKALCADSVVGITGGFTPLTGFSFPSHLECGSAAGAPQVILNYEAALTLGATTKNGGGGGETEKWGGCGSYGPFKSAQIPQQLGQKNRAVSLQQ